MNIETLKELTRKAVKKKKGGKKIFIARNGSKYPAYLERDYLRIFNTFVKVLKESLTDEIRKAVLNKQDGFFVCRKTLHFDKEKDEQDLKKLQRLRKKIAEAYAKLSDSANQNELVEALNELGKRVIKHSVKDWKRLVRQTLGINIYEDYYKGETYKGLIDNWVNANVDLIKSIPKDMASKMQTVVEKAYSQGSSLKDTAREMQEVFSVSKNKARFLARDQLAKVSSQLTRNQQEDAGVSEYIWRTSGDARVRHSHSVLNNKKFRYDDPPVVDEETGRRGNPGEDYQCRCVALPVFNLKDLVLPYEADARKEV